MLRLRICRDLPQGRGDPGLATPVGRAHRPLEATQGPEEGSFEGDELSVDPIGSSPSLDKG